MPLPRSFTDLVNNLTILPGVGEKTAERFVYSLYEKDFDEVENLAESLVEFKKTIRNCSVCGCLSDEEICDVCQDNTRDKETICIVEDSKNVFFIEKTKKYNGYYHVLNGLISPIDGINPEDLNIASLINDRLDNVKEIISTLFANKVDVDHPENKYKDFKDLEDKVEKRLQNRQTEYQNEINQLSAPGVNFDDI